MGANPDVEPDDIVRFAQMASAYARVVCGIEHPSVACFPTDRGAQGVALHAGVLPLMAERVPGFAGNCEGTDLLSGRLDVIVSDGFAGTSRSRRPRVRQSTLLGELKGALMGSIKGKIAALLVKDALYAIKDKLSGDARGGAILLGLKGVVLIGHGATSVEAVKNGTLATARAVRAGLVDAVASSVDGIVA